MLTLQTSEQMYQYCVDNKLGGKSTPKWMAIKHFQLLIDNLRKSEEIFCVFVGVHNYESMRNNDDNFAYAVTNERIIMAQSKTFKSNVQSISIQNINDITLSKSGIAGMGIGVICIDTFKETFNVGVNISDADNVYKSVQNALDEIKGSIFGNKEKVISNSIGNSLVEQVKELKELVDMGILTQEEFEAKKKQILDL